MPPEDPKKPEMTLEEMLRIFVPEGTKHNFDGLTPEQIYDLIAKRPGMFGIGDSHFNLFNDLKSGKGVEHLNEQLKNSEFHTRQDVRDAMQDEIFRRDECISPSGTLNTVDEILQEHRDKNDEFGSKESTMLTRSLKHTIMNNKGVADVLGDDKEKELATKLGREANKNDQVRVLGIAVAERDQIVDERCAQYTLGSPPPTPSSAFPGDAFKKRDVVKKP